ncbi:MAG: hypothetical protein ACI853_000062 [Paracoccaceae bacterium]|jgi:hypothetical protein
MRSFVKFGLTCAVTSWSGGGVLRVLALAFAAGLVTGAASAEPVDTKAAREALFTGKGRSVTIFAPDFLDEDVLKAVKAYAGKFDYYAAFAVSQGDPADTGSAVGLSNFHSVQAARDAALVACNARRTTGAACIVIAVTTPKRYTPQPVELSAEASEAFRKQYRKLDPPKAFAASPVTGAWAIERGDGGRALSGCNARAAAKGARDCAIVIFDK